MLRFFLLLLSASACGVSVGRTQPVPPEFQINISPLAAAPPVRLEANHRGDFIVVWRESIARIYSARDGAFGPELAVPPREPQSEGEPPWSMEDMALGPDGNFIVTRAGQYAGDMFVGSSAREFDSNGLPLTDEVELGGIDTFLPTVSIDAAGGILITTTLTDWHGGPMHSRVAGRLDAHWNSAGRVFVLEDVTSAGVSMNASGDVAVSWKSSSSLLARVISRTNVPGPIRTVVTGSALRNRGCIVRDDGGFTVLWRVRDNLFGRRYDMSSAPVGPEFRFDASVDGVSVVDGTITPEPGGFIVAVSSDRNGIGPHIVARRFDHAGRPRSPDFRVNVRETGRNGQPLVAALAGGSFVIVWPREDPPGTYSLVGRFFDATTAVEPSTWSSIKDAYR